MIGCMSFMNQPILQYSNEIRSAVLVMHGEKAHSCYFSRDAYAAMVKDNPDSDNKQLLIIPDAVHTDLYDGGGKNLIPFDKLEQFDMFGLNYSYLERNPWEMGKAAMEMLLERLKNPSILCTRKIIPFHIIMNS